MTDHAQDYVARVRKVTEPETHKEIDGYYCWFPKGIGGLSAVDLRIIADLLDEKNKDWNEQVLSNLQPPSKQDEL